MKYPEKGKKFDNGKPRWDLMPLDVIEEIVKVLTFGAKKYGPNNWQNVEPFKDRYFAALQRHLVKWQQGCLYDEEFFDIYGKKISHLAFAGCNIVFLLWKELHGDDVSEVSVEK